MLRIRLQRVGRKNIPAFRIVLTESRNSTKSGRYKEILGSYNPVKKTKAVNAERLKHWISVGAKPTDTMQNFLIREKIITGKKINVLSRTSLMKKEEIKEEKGEKSAEVVATASVAEVAIKPTEEKPAETTPVEQKV